MSIQLMDQMTESANKILICNNYHTTKVTVFGMVVVVYSTVVLDMWLFIVQKQMWDIWPCFWDFGVIFAQNNLYSCQNQGRHWGLLLLNNNNENTHYDMSGKYEN